MAVIVDFDHGFELDLDLLCRLFGQNHVEDVLPRLKFVYEYTEKKWQEYANQLRDIEVRYVLICEAPPWSAHGPAQYFLDPDSRVRTLMSALRRAFPGLHRESPTGALRKLASYGFALFDSLPFSMDYSSKRSSPRYDDLVSSTTKSYLFKKIDACGLRWSSDLRIAFSLYLNARSIIRAAPGISFGGRSFPINEDLIAVNAAHYPDSDRLRHIYGFD